ncbi:MAG: MFS transporter [Nitrospirota bacterium]|nr:MAG: MFS transporter [Nitrospirota bacterium]
MNSEKKVLSALRIGDFRNFWVSQVISLSGTWMQHVAIGWLVYEMTSSPLYLGLTMMVLSAPIMVFTLIGGIFADRHPKRNILIGTQVMSIVPAITLAVLTDLQIIELWHIFLIVFMIGTLNAFDIPARQSFFVEMVGKSNLLNAIALNSAAFNGARVLGPLFAGLIISRINIETCFYINGLSFAPAILVMMNIKTRGTGKVVGRRSIISELGEGISFICGNIPIRTVFITIALISLFGIPYSSFLPVIAEDILNTGAEGLGRLGGASGAGALIAALIIALKGTIRRRAAYMSIAIMGGSLSIFALTFSDIEIISLLVLVITGFGIVSYLANANNFIQQSVPDSIRGRVMSAYILVFLGMSPVGNLLVGYLAEFIGTMNALRVSSVVCIAASFYFIKNSEMVESRNVH